MVITIKHGVSRDEAKTRILNLLQDVKKQHSGVIQNYFETWNQYAGNIRLSVKNFDIAGTIDIERIEIVVKLRIPLLANIFRSRIKEEILRTLGASFG